MVNFMNKRDGHIHTPFCPHGTSDPLHAYVDKAEKSGFTDISFTEHAPLPAGFMDTTPAQDSGMNNSEMSAYFNALNEVKPNYPNMRIRSGLEVDFIQGFENQTSHLLEQVGPYLEDAILSVWIAFSRFCRWRAMWRVRAA